jgi:hypothetical protein
MPDSINKGYYKFLKFFAYSRVIMYSNCKNLILVVVSGEGKLRMLEDVVLSQGISAPQEPTPPPIQEHPASRPGTSL